MDYTDDGGAEQMFRIFLENTEYGTPIKSKNYRHNKDKNPVSAKGLDSEEWLPEWTALKSLQNSLFINHIPFL